MNKLKMGAKAGVTLVELLVVILIITILAVGMLPLLKPFIEQAKYAAEAQPVLGSIQTKINLYQYEKDQLPCTKVTTDSAGKKKEQDSAYTTASTWIFDSSKSQGAARVYKKSWQTSMSGTPAAASESASGESGHISDFVDVDWQDLMGKRINPSQFSYYLIKGLGAANYGYAIGLFGDGDGIAKGTGYAILVLVDTDKGIKVIATWERYKPVNDKVVMFKAEAAGAGSKTDEYCHIPDMSAIKGKDKGAWSELLTKLKNSGWAFNFDELAVSNTSGGDSTTPVTGGE